MNIGISPVWPGLAGGAAAATALLAVFGSNRLQRSLYSVVARSVGRFPSSRRRHVMNVVTRLENTRAPEDFLEQLPWVASRAAGMAHVTLFVLEDEQFVAVRSTRLAIRPEPVSQHEPLVGILRSAETVHYLLGRSDDLQNAPIHAVNGGQVEACKAVAAIPLRRAGSLVGFLLCGGPMGAGELDLTTMSALESVARCCTEKLESFAETRAIPNPVYPASEPGAPAPIVHDRRLRAARAFRQDGDSDRVGIVENGSAEPQMAGMRGGFETTE